MPMDDGFSEVIAEAPPASIGHNLGPSLLFGEPLRERLNSTHAEALKRATELIESEARVPRDDHGALICPDDVWEKKLTEVVRQIQGAHKALDIARASEKQPYDNAASLVHGLFRDVMDKLVDPATRGTNALKHRIERALTNYKVHKEQAARRAAEEAAERARVAERMVRIGLWLASLSAARQAAEAQRLADEAAAKARGPKTNATAAALAEAARVKVDQAKATAAAPSDTLAEAANARAKAETAAAAPAADLSRIRSQHAVSSLQEFVNYRDIDRMMLNPEKLWPHLAVDAIEAAVKSYIRANGEAIKDEVKNNRQPLRGVTFFIDHRTNVR